MKIIDGDKVIEITPELVAELFANMDAGEQARFFNHIDTVASTWGIDADLLPFQMQAITDDDGLTLAGRRVMQMIGEYSHWGLVPTANKMGRGNT